MTRQPTKSRKQEDFRANMDRWKETLRGAGLRATRPRMAVLEILEGAKSPISHPEVAEVLVQEGFDRATVYRNLIDLADVGLVRRSDLGDHTWRFELTREGEEHEGDHAHFVCRSCGTVSCLPDSAFSMKIERGAPRMLKQACLEIQVRGVCDTCS